MADKTLTNIAPSILDILPTEILCRILKFLYKLSHWKALEKTNRQFRQLIRDECWAKRVKSIKFICVTAWCRPELHAELPSLHIYLRGNFIRQKTQLRELHSYKSFVEFWIKCQKVLRIKIKITKPPGHKAASGPHPKSIVPDPAAHKRLNFCDISTGVNEPCYQFLQFIRNAQKAHPKSLSMLSIVANHVVSRPIQWQPPTVSFMSKSLATLTVLHMDDNGRNWKLYLELIQQAPRLISIRLQFNLSQLTVGLRKKSDTSLEEVVTLILGAIKDRKLKELCLYGLPWKEETAVSTIQRLITHVQTRESFRFDMCAPILFTRTIKSMSAVMTSHLLRDPSPPFNNQISHLLLGPDSGWLDTVPHLLILMPRVEKIEGLHITIKALQFIQAFPYNILAPRYEMLLITFPLESNSLRFSYQHFLQETRKLIQERWFPPHVDFTAELVEHSPISSTIVCTHPLGTLRFHIPET